MSNKDSKLLDLALKYIEMLEKEEDSQDSKQSQMTVHLYKINQLISRLLSDENYYHTIKTQYGIKLQTGNKPVLDADFITYALALEPEIKK